MNTKFKSHISKKLRMRFLYKARRKGYSLKNLVENTASKSPNKETLKAMKDAEQGINLEIIKPGEFHSFITEM